VNRQELRERILYRLNEDITSPTFYTETIANNAIQEAMEIIAEEIATLRQQALIVAKPGRHWFTTYEVSDVCMTPIRVWSHGTGQRLLPITMLQLEQHYSHWITVTADRPQWWYPLSHDAFGIWPGTVEGGTVLRVDFLAWPETLAADSDEPIIDEVTQDLVILYGEYDGLIRQWEFERAMDLFTRFAQHYLDTKFRSETRRFQHIHMNRVLAGYNMGNQL